MHDDVPTMRENQKAERDPLGCLAGGGEMAERIRSFNWAKTPLGPPQSWSPALRTTLRILLANRFPQLLWWGPQYVQFYNDPYSPVPGTKHPHRALGQPGNECWSEIWHVLQPLVDTPFHGGPATWNDDILLELNRHGFLEESHFTIAYSPVPDETVPSGIGGVLATVHEITGKIIAERRVRILRDLGARLGEATRNASQACAAVAETLAAHDREIPFALLYLIDSEGVARLAGAAGVEMGTDISPLNVDLSSPHIDGWPMFKARATETLQVVEQIQTHFATVPAGPWSDPPHTAVVVPIPSNKTHDLAGLMVAGVSARLQFDQDYRDFFGLVASQVAAAIANAREYEEEKKRSEALAELDRAKTAFFSNVSHEFRTPLTLMLGPVEDILAGSRSAVPPDIREQLQVVHRNGLRLQKLVNTLLDFSRIEAGRVQASYEPTDLSSFTSELASNFRSACEKAGLQLEVDCLPLAEPVFVDRDMWEKIVLNLLSNAFKFTLDGRIEVTLRQIDKRVELTVRDTGSGIPRELLPKIFDRFQRVEGARARTQEGSGIGLALVRELVKLHGGEVAAESTYGKGSIFTVTIPLGTAHLPADRIDSSRTIASTALGAAPFVEEALRWLPNTPAGAPTAPAVPLAEGRSGLGQGLAQGFGRGLAVGRKRFRILLADDNTDMREYVQRLLCEHYDVTAVADGQAAWQAAQENVPDLVLTDLMMPGIDGLGLLRLLRAEPRTAEVPVILLTARAGDESRIAGLEASADDYLTKPFNARELLVRVQSRLELASFRHEIQEQLKEADRHKDEFLATLAHELRNPLAPIRSGLQLMRFAANNEAVAEKARTIVERQVDQMVRLVDDLLDIARISQNKLDLRREWVDVETVMKSAVETSRPVIDAGHHSLEVSLPSEPVWLNADPVRLAQALANLLNNAAKYSESGRQIWLSAERQNRELVLKVRDMGVGIHRDELHHIFGVFVQVDRSERSRGGLGIGLSLVRRIVEIHGGVVEARSEGPGKGSEFLIRLPESIVATAAVEEKREGNRAARSATRRRVLVADDNYDAAESMSLMLEIAGHEVVTAHDGLEALELAETFRPEVAFLDLGMPRLNGCETARQIRQEAWGKNVLLVALTGWGQEEDKRRSKESGFDVHLVKPVDPQAMAKILADRDGPGSLNPQQQAV